MTRDADNRTTELLCCPFCGGEAEIIEAVYGMYLTGYAIYCRKCCLKLGVTGRLGEAYEWSPVFNTEAEAIAAWNARAERTCRMETAEGCQNWNSCSECDADYYTDQPINYCPNCGARVIG